MTDSKLREAVRLAYLNSVINLFKDKGAEVLRTNSNEIAIPCVDGDMNECFVVVTVKVPTGGRDGDGYDGYSVAESYALHLKEMADKAEQNSKAKSKKSPRTRQNTRRKPMPRRSQGRA